MICELYFKFTTVLFTATKFADNLSSYVRNRSNHVIVSHTLMNLFHQSFNLIFGVFHADRLFLTWVCGCSFPSHNFPFSREHRNSLSCFSSRRTLPSSQESVDFDAYGPFPPSHRHLSRNLALLQPLRFLPLHPVNRPSISFPFVSRSPPGIAAFPLLQTHCFATGEVLR
jgi:hypothetical protein